MDTAERLGPAERILQALTSYTDHLFHHRPGIVTKSAAAIGVTWTPASTRTKDDVVTVFRLPTTKGQGKRVVVGTLDADGKTIKAPNGAVVGEFRKPGVFPEVARWMFAQVADVWKLDNEFSARWASWSFKQTHRDLQVILAAFMLVQNRCGEPEMDDGKLLFKDEDFRNVGEAMILGPDGTKGMDAKMILRIQTVLEVPGVAEIVHTLNFGRSDRRPFLGRWPKVVEKWLRFREDNLPLLRGLVKAGFKTTVRALASAVGYKPTSAKFFEILGWKQKQAEDGRRTMAIGKDHESDSWKDMTEAQICKRIAKGDVSWKVIVGKVPTMTRAIVVAAVDAGAIGDKEAIMLMPLFEELGLLKEKSIRVITEKALGRAKDARAANIAKNVRDKDVKEKLVAAADKAVQKEVEEVSRDVRIYVMVDVSSSMQGAIEGAKPLIASLVQALPADRVHVSVFNTFGRVVTIPHASTKGVDAAFKGIRADGGTDHMAGIMAHKDTPPKPHEDVIFFFVGDEQDQTFGARLRAFSIKPQAFAMLHVGGVGHAVKQTAVELGIPCTEITAGMFSDVYAVPRILRTILSATPTKTIGVPTVPRVTLVETILKTDLLQRPLWAA